MIMAVDFLENGDEENNIVEKKYVAEKYKFSKII